MTSLRVRLLFAALVLVGCDHATKHVAKASLEGEPPRPVVGQLLDLQYRENHDTAFSLLRFIPESPRGVIIKVAGAVALVVLAGLLLRRRAPFDLTTAALLLFAAGAVGNYSERLIRGYVVDFIHVPYWPVFNVADAYVTVGMGLLLWKAFRERAGRPAAV